MVMVVWIWGGRGWGWGVRFKGQGAEQGRRWRRERMPSGARGGPARCFSAPKRLSPAAHAPAPLAGPLRNPPLPPTGTKVYHHERPSQAHAAHITAPSGRPTYSRPSWGVIQPMGLGRAGGGAWGGVGAWVWAPGGVGGAPPAAGWTAPRSCAPPAAGLPLPQTWSRGAPVVASEMTASMLWCMPCTQRKRNLLRWLQRWTAKKKASYTLGVGVEGAGWRGGGGVRWGDEGLKARQAWGARLPRPNLPQPTPSTRPLAPSQA
jgi:hypothetical protein